MNKPMIYKITFKQTICFQLGETIHIRINYINLPKERFFIMITTHLVAINIIIDSRLLSS